MAKVIWSKRAFSQLERNIKFLKEERGISVAELVLEKILKPVASLESFSEVGQLEPLLLHRKSNYRYLVVWSYKTLYKVETNRITISRVFHSARNPKN